MGFEYQVRSIVQNVRPSRQTLLFSATFPPKIERLAHDLLHQPVRITVGESGQAAANVVQSVEVLKNDDEKWAWLSKRADAMLVKGQVLIFVKSIASAEELTQNFADFLGKKTEFLHGDLDQSERMRILRAFRKRKIDVLIATDVAARGLDIPTIYTVVSYDVARDIETHTHRVGRTGRAGATGEAFTLITIDDPNKKMAALLVENLELASQPVSNELRGLAMKYGPFRAAKLAGRKFEGKKKGGGTQAVHSSFGVGFDGAATMKETPKDLENRLNREADKMASINRKIMAGSGGRGARAELSMLAANQSRCGTAGFVKAATTDTVPVQPRPPKKDDSSSDDDLFAPGVTSAFGRGRPVAKAAAPGGVAAATHAVAPMQRGTATRPMAAEVPPQIAMMPTPAAVQPATAWATALQQQQMQQLQYWQQQTALGVGLPPFLPSFAHSNNHGSHSGGATTTRQSRWERSRSRDEGKLRSRSRNKRRRRSPSL